MKDLGRGRPEGERRGEKRRKEKTSCLTLV
jgi:hypothetical protein